MRLCGARSGARGILRQPRAKARAVVPHTPQPMTRTRRSSILAAHAALGVAADEWRANADSVLGGYALRQGVAHDLAAGRIEGARARVTNFDWAQTRTARIGGARVEPDAAEATQPIEDTVSQLCDDYTAVARSVPAGDDAVQMWAAFMRERAHILRRGDEKWATNKILLQLAVEHADDSPVTQAAEAWLADGGCDWLWLRRARRVAHAVPDPCRRVFEGHTSWVEGALLMPSGEVLSWALDHTLRLWDAATGECRAVMEGHTWSVDGVLLMPSGEVLSWANDHTLRLWDPATAECRAVMEGHTDSVRGALLMPSGEVLSWADDNTLRLWDPANGECRAVMEGHTNDVKGALLMPSGEVLSWAAVDTLRLWDPATAECRAVMEGHTNWVNGALPMPSGEVLSWADDNTLRLWDPATGDCRAVMKGHTDSVRGALLMPSGELLSWARDHTLRLWDAGTGEELQTVSMRDAAATAPELHHAQRNAVRPHSTLDETIFSDGGQGGVALVERPAVLHWHANGEWDSRHLFEDGTVVATCSKDLAFLRLYEGARRVSLSAHGLARLAEEKR